MTREYTFFYSCKGDAPERDFFKLFPNVKEEKEVHRSPQVMRTDRWGMPDYIETIVYAGSALLSSATVASAIKAWIEGKRRKIVISVGNKRIEYEGPDIVKDLKAIETMIDDLEGESESNHLQVSAELLPSVPESRTEKEGQHSEK